MERLRNLAHRAQAPAWMVERPNPATVIDSSLYDVKAGQVWTARVESVMTVVVMRVGSDPRAVCVVPATIEPGMETADAWVVDGDTSPLDVPMCVWPELLTEIPVRLLDRPLGELESVVVPFFRASSPSTPHSVRPECAADNPFGPAARTRAFLSDTLSAWSILVGDLPELVAQPHPVGKGNPEYSFDDLRAIGLPTAEAIAVHRGSRDLTAGEAADMAAHLGRPLAAAGGGHNLTAEALAEVEQPRWRWLSELMDGGVDSAAARIGLGRAAFALAARQQGEDASACRQRLRMLALAHLPEDQQAGR
jgi:hypothetical protein